MKKQWILTFGILFLFQIGYSQSGLHKTDTSHYSYPPFEKILSKNKLRGSILVFNPETNSFYSNDFEWAQTGRLPASTYKIPHSLIALETGVAEDTSFHFSWDGEDRFLDIWEQDLNLAQALKYSCVPCYQELAARIGVQRMAENLNILSYGQMDVNADNLRVFWLEGDSRISQFEQIDFLKRLFYSELPVSHEAQKMVRDMIRLENAQNWKLSGKTGWAIRNGENNGWFVGYLETEKHLLFFATNVKPEVSFNMDLFPVIRQKVTEKALKNLLNSGLL